MVFEVVFYNGEWSYSRWSFIKDRFIEDVSGPIEARLMYLLTKVGAPRAGFVQVV